jgi:hypothetical protein
MSTGPFTPTYVTHWRNVLENRPQWIGGWYSAVNIRICLLSPAPPMHILCYFWKSWPLPFYHFTDTNVWQQVDNLLEVADPSVRTLIVFKCRPNAKKPGEGFFNKFQATISHCLTYQTRSFWVCPYLMPYCEASIIILFCWDWTSGINNLVVSIQPRDRWPEPSFYPRHSWSSLYALAEQPVSSPIYTIFWWPLNSLTKCKPSLPKLYIQRIEYNLPWPGWRLTRTTRGLKIDVAGTLLEEFAVILLHRNNINPFHDTSNAQCFAQQPQTIAHGSQNAAYPPSTFVHTDLADGAADGTGEADFLGDTIIEGMESPSSLRPKTTVFHRIRNTQATVITRKLSTCHLSQQSSGFPLSIVDTEQPASNRVVKYYTWIRVTLENDEQASHAAHFWALWRLEGTRHIRKKVIYMQSSLLLYPRKMKAKIVFTSN